MNIREKFVGGMIGSALGDCIGEIAFTVNDKAKLKKIIDSKQEITYTDDTAMAIGLAESIIANKGKIKSEHLGKVFHKNFLSEPYRGYAMGPPSIFYQVEQTGQQYETIAQQLFEGKGSFGNGASMRIAPLGLFFHDNPHIYEISEQSAIVTHAHPLGIEGAAVLAKAIGLVVELDPEISNSTVERDQYLDLLISYSKTEQFKEKLYLVKDLLKEEKKLQVCAKQLGANVEALKSVPFSILSFLRNSCNFEDCLLDTVLVSGDRDTIGAMVGALLGAYLGIQKIANHWIEKLENRAYIESLSLQLVELKKDEH